VCGLIKDGLQLGCTVNFRHESKQIETEASIFCSCAKKSTVVFLISLHLDETLKETEPRLTKPCEKKRKRKQETLLFLA
jgi:hypothetical protein